MSSGPVNGGAGALYEYGAFQIFQRLVGGPAVGCVFIYAGLRAEIVGDTIWFRLLLVTSGLWLIVTAIRFAASPIRYIVDQRWLRCSYLSGKSADWELSDLVVKREWDKLGDTSTAIARRTTGRVVFRIYSHLPGYGALVAALMESIS